MIRSGLYRHLAIPQELPDEDYHRLSLRNVTPKAVHLKPILWIVQILLQPLYHIANVFLVFSGNSEFYAVQEALSK